MDKEETQNSEPASSAASVPPTKKSGGLKKFLMILLILLLIGAAGGGAWYAQQKKINKLEKDKKAAEEKADKAGSAKSGEKREVVRVQVARPASRSFSVEIPLDWLSGTCGEDLLFIANTEQRLGKCDTEYFGMMSFSWAAGDTREPTATYSSNPDYADFTSAAVTINGVSGDKLTYRFVGESLVGYPATGSSFITYRLFDGTNTFIATYDRNAGETDYRTDFEAIVETLDTTP